MRLPTCWFPDEVSYSLVGSNSPRAVAGTQKSRVPLRQLS